MVANASKPLVRQLVLFVGVLSALGCACRAYAPEGTAAIVRDAGPVLFVAWLAPLGLASIDSVGLRSMLARLGEVRPLSALFALRFGLEAVASTAPLGPLAADASLPVVFGRALALPATSGVAVVAARKWALLSGHAVAVTIALAVGYASLARIVVPRVGLSAALVLVVMASTLTALALTIRYASRLEDTLIDAELAPHRDGVSSRVRRFVVHAARSARTILAPRDGGATRLAALYTGLWLFEALDTYVLLRLLDAPISLGDALVVETIAAVAKSAAFASPGGLGAQDVAYVFALEAVIGVPAAALAVAFVVVRRVRELGFVALGFGVLAAMPFVVARRARGASASGAIAVAEGAPT